MELTNIDGKSTVFNAEFDGYRFTTEPLPERFEVVSARVLIDGVAIKEMNDSIVVEQQGQLIGHGGFDMVRKPRSRSNTEERSQDRLFDTPFYNGQNIVTVNGYKGKYIGQDPTQSDGYHWVYLFCQSQPTRVHERNLLHDDDMMIRTLIDADSQTFMVRVGIQDGQAKVTVE